MENQRNLPRYPGGACSRLGGARLLATLLASIAANATIAHEFCVGSAADLAAACAAVSNNGAYNGEDNLIDLQAGNYTKSQDASFYVNSSTAHALQVSGGWNADCSAQTPDPTLSVLDGAAAGTVLVIENGGATTVSYLTIRNGRQPAGMYAAGLTLVETTGAPIATVSHNIIENNYATVTIPVFQAQPAGIAVTFSGGAYLINNLIAGNTSEGTMAAGEIYVTGNDCVTNNTVVDNVASNSDDIGGLFLHALDASGAFVVNNIFWGNTRAGLALENDSNLLLNNDYGVLGGAGSPAAGSTANLSVGPEFVDRPNGDYHLSGKSPLLGKGDANPECGLPSRDLDGHSRTLGGSVDIGAYQESIFISGFDLPGNL